MRGGVGLGGALRLSASLQTLLFFSSCPRFMVFFIFPVFAVVIRLYRPPSPPPKGRMTQIGTSFTKDFALWAPNAPLTQPLMD